LFEGERYLVFRGCVLVQYTRISFRRVDPSGNVMAFNHLLHLALGLPLFARCLLLLHCHGRILISSAGVGEDIHQFPPAFDRSNPFVFHHVLSTLWILAVCFDTQPSNTLYINRWHVCLFTLSCYFWH
jgi:hypothetical protein